MTCEINQGNLIVTEELSGITGYTTRIRRKTRGGNKTTVRKAV